jgi:hypothetical protein
MDVKHLPHWPVKSSEIIYYGITPREDIRRHGVPKEVYVLALTKQGERFVFVYDRESQDELLEDLQDLAGEATCPLTGFDVAVLAGKMREQVQHGEPARLG